MKSFWHIKSFLNYNIDIELEDDPEQKIVEDSQEKDFLEADFQLDEELGDGEDIEQDILLEEDEEGDNDANDEEDDEEVDNEDIEEEEEEEEKTDEVEVKELEEGVEIIKLEEPEPDDSVQAEATDSNDKQDEVLSHSLECCMQCMQLYWSMNSNNYIVYFTYEIWNSGHTYIIIWCKLYSFEVI